MNEQQFSLHVRRALDESAGKLPYKVTHRLGNAREQALARMSATPVALASLESSSGAVPAGASATLSGGGAGWRLTGTALPLLILVAGLLFMAAWDISEKAEELAEVEAGMLADDVPLDIYADRGFGVFLKNSRQ